MDNSWGFGSDCEYGSHLVSFPTSSICYIYLFIIKIYFLERVDCTYTEVHVSLSLEQAQC